MHTALRHAPSLDPGFLPAAVWNGQYRARLGALGRQQDLSLAFAQDNGQTSIFHTEVFPHEPPFEALNGRYVERLFKFLLWQRGGCRVTVVGEPRIARSLADLYQPGGPRSFDHQFIGEQVYRRPLEIVAGRMDELDIADSPSSIRLGRHFDGCRIGLDLGGTGRKVVALINGQIVFSESVRWNPSAASDPRYHRAGIVDALQRAADRLPRVDGIGVSAAGVYVGNQVRAASLFRGVSAQEFERSIRRMFIEMAQDWDGIPFEVANDGEVAALAGSMALNVNAALGLSFGTSQAGGYVDETGGIRPWLNELAFAPVDYRLDAPVDPWSGDAGCGVMYFSQQGVARLLPAAGIVADAATTDAERLTRVQALTSEGDPRGIMVYETLGAYLGYTLAHYAEFYELRHVLLTGGVTAGRGGDLLLEKARAVLVDEFPPLAEQVSLHLSGEKERSFGQAAAAASLPSWVGNSLLEPAGDLR